MIASSAGTATGDTPFLPVSDHQSESFLTPRNLMKSNESKSTHSNAPGAKPI